jgi:hypothetical protein
MQEKHNNCGVFSPRGRTYYARGSYFPLPFNIRVNKSIEIALPSCILSTFKVHGEYYYREFFIALFHIVYRYIGIYRDFNELWGKYRDL